MEYYFLSIIISVILFLRLIASIIIANIYVNINMTTMSFKEKVLYFFIFLFLPEILIGSTINNLLYKSKIRIIKQRIRYKNINNKYKYKYK